MARQRRTTVLRLSHHGRAGDDPHAGDGDRGPLALAKQTRAIARDALDTDAERYVSIHRHHGGLVDCRVGPSTLGDSWTVAHGTGRLTASQRGQCGLYSIGFCGV